MGAYLSRRRNRFMNRFLVSHLLILFLPMLVFAIGFQETSQIIKQNELESNLDSLDRTKYVIDQSLLGINKLVSSISTDPNLQWLMNHNGALDTQDYSSLYESFQTVQALYNLSPIGVMRYYIIYPNSGIVLSPAGTYNLQDFYGYPYYIPNYSKEQWLEQYLSSSAGRFIPSGSVMIEGKEAQAVTYLRSIPVNSYGDAQAMVMVLIDANRLKNQLLSANVLGGNAYIADAEGQILISVNPDPVHTLQDSSRGYKEVQINGDNMLLSWIVSEENGFQYAVLTRTRSVMFKLRKLQFTVILVSSICLVSGIGIAWLLSYANAKPLKEILATVKGKWDGQTDTAYDDFKYLKSALSAIVDYDSTLRQQILSNLPLARANFIGKLLQGEISDKAEAESLKQQLELNLDGNLYNSVIICIDGYYERKSPEILRELNTLKAVIRSIWNEYWGSSLQWYSWDLSEQAIAFLTVHTEPDPDQCREALSRCLAGFHESVTNELKQPVFYEFGTFCTDIIDVYIPFGEAWDQVKRRLQTIPLLSDDLPDKNQWIYFYPLELEQRLVNVIKTGNLPELQKILEIIYNENFRRNRITDDMSSNLFNEIRGTILKIFKELNISDYDQIYSISSLLKQIKVSTDIEERFQLTQQLMQYMCNIVNENRETGVKNTVEAIRHYIFEQYTDSGLNLPGIASHFHFSDTNFSYFFKEHFQETFSAYLERLRISTACELIKETELSVEDIALRIGYNSSGSFRRAFKRAKGIIPSEYKKLHEDSTQA